MITEQQDLLQRPSGVDGIIPDGHRWTSATGIKCYKIPVKQMTDCLFVLPKMDVTQFTDAQLVKATEYVNARFAERRTGEYLVFPVRFEKQADVNNRYWQALAAFSKAVQTEQAQRQVGQLFGSE